VRIGAQIDNTQLLLRMRNGEKRLAYATVNAINATALRVQQAEFENVRQKFTIRQGREAFFFGSPTRPGGVAARLFKASVKQSRPFAEVFVGRASSISSQRRLLLPLFEQGGVKKGKAGRPVAIPVTGSRARPAFGRHVDPQYTWAGMRLEAYQAGKKVRREVRGSGGKVRKKSQTLFNSEGRFSLPANDGRTQWKGRHRTFLLFSTARNPQGGVYRRTGPGRGDIQLIWKFKDEVAIDARLGFVRVADVEAGRWFREFMQQETIRAIEFSRGRGL
jgi:hypothetical protein